MVIKEEEKLNRNLCQPGSSVFYWEPDHGWALGKVEADSGKHFKVSGLGYSATKKGELATVDKVPDDKIWPIRDDVLDEDCDDLLSLTVLHDATIQRCLYIRYMKNVVYTNIGQIVVALNPWNFKIACYMDDFMPKYLEEGEVVKNQLPHSWAQAHNTFHDMRREECNQCILISGESGAGKTEAAKIVMKYLGALSCKQGTAAEKDAAKNVAFNINQASPILEGFGNAKTVRNDNSSRFGKFMKVQFSQAGFLVGAFTIKYLLEKSRIVTASRDERVYHAFYLVTKGCDAKAKYNLGEVAGYHTNAGQCIDIPGVDDGEDYSICITAMKNCGFSDTEVDGVWRIVAGITHLLQLSFQAIDADSCKIDGSTDNLIDQACDLWMTDAAVFRSESTTTTMSTRDGPVTKRLTTVKAVDNRDALVKTLYDQLFGWEVETINKLTDSGTGSNWIGLLDIFGFEDFEYNSFEQICINLANETLQNHYNTFIFTKDMDECRAEGINVTEVTCPDNMPCLLLMTSKTGIFGLLDDECSLGQGSDGGFLQKVLDTNGKNPFLATKKMARNSFLVHHYAASVNYTVEGWLDKNRDSLKPAMKLFMRASNHDLICRLIEEPAEDQKKETVGGFFRKQLTMLMDLINSTNPHWIRCVKPHPAKKPLMVDGITAMQQLESSGVLGTVKIRKAGFPVRTPFMKFIARFKVILPLPHPPASSGEKEKKEFCLRLCKHAGIEELKAQAGSTKMFLKNEANQHLESEREKALSLFVKTIHRCAAYQMSLSAVAYRRQLKKFNDSAAVIQEISRAWYAKSQEVRAQREAERKERDRILSAFKSKQGDAESRLLRYAGEYAVPQSLPPLEESHTAEVDLRVAKMSTPEVEEFSKIRASNPKIIPFALKSRPEGESLCSRLAEVWFDKPGDILDEWEENFLPCRASGLSVLGILSEACHSLLTSAPKAEEERGDRGMSILFTRALLTMEGSDLDRLLGHPFEVDPEKSLMLTPVNPSVASEISASLSEGGDLRRWVKTLCLAASLSRPTPSPLDFTSRNFEVSNGGRLQMFYWAMNSLGPSTPRPGGPDATPPTPENSDTLILAGVREAIYTGNVSQYPGVRSYVIPPLASFGGDGCPEGTYTWRGSAASGNVFLKELRGLCLADAACADARLLKIREKLQEKRIEAEKERQKEAAEEAKRAVGRLESAEEPAARREVVAECDRSYGDAIEVFNSLVAMFYGAQMAWLGETHSGIRKTVMRQELLERKHLVLGLVSGSVQSSQISTKQAEEVRRRTLVGLEAALRAEILGRRKIVLKEMASRRKASTVMSGGATHARELQRRREAFDRKRRKEMAKLQRLREDEIHRLFGSSTGSLPGGASSGPIPQALAFSPFSSPGGSPVDAGGGGYPGQPQHRRRRDRHQHRNPSHGFPSSDPGPLAGVGVMGLTGVGGSSAPHPPGALPSSGSPFGGGMPLPSPILPEPEVGEEGVGLGVVAGDLPAYHVPLAHHSGVVGAPESAHSAQGWSAGGGAAGRGYGGGPPAAAAASAGGGAASSLSSTGYAGGGVGVGAGGGIGSLHSSHTSRSNAASEQDLGSTFANPYLRGMEPPAGGSVHSSG